MSAFARLRLFRPILAGATLRDRALACFGALIGIGLSAVIGGVAAADFNHLVWIVPPMGASAVLLFAVPASPMAQPWPAIGGNVISAAIGVAVGHFMPLTALSAGLAVALAIGIMSLLRCLHPPGGAAALVGLFIGGSSSLLFPFVPVGLNAVVLVASAWLYHRVSGHSYPHVAAPPQPARARDLPWTISKADIAATLAEFGEAFDIGAEDLEELVRHIERRAVARSYHQLNCANLMVKNVISVPEDASPDQARALLVKRDIRRLAVVDAEGRLVGSIGLRELVRPAAQVREAMTPAAAAAPASPAIDLLERYARDRVHAVFIVDADRRPVGVVTEADWLHVLTRGLG
ncbi:CBS domain-containing membrane protein [Ancylobacter sp. 3268]|uniref:HPP family protein n=1 Tax=Ancylobacter sp. 3268 TaxID=2817752 RepID=UPI00285D72CF|nr:HPP family protein [Ancylobacter sp. 3268]MDR6953360.1 CBS domain-containing membrane protein [Ancylobacter sp. 3268]